MQCGPATQTARLSYVSDADEGIRREPSASGFVYRDAAGRPVSDPAVLDRIQALAVPPAWTDVWICSDPSGHLQATGRDARGRKQYRYHAEWRDLCEANKFDHLAAFGQALPAIRAQVTHDLARRGMPREKVLALVIRLLDETLLRVGNEEYARANEAYGLTTLRDQHARVEGSELRLVFTGKGGKTQTASVRDRRLARAVLRSQELPGEILFQYEEEGGRVTPVTSGDVNQYLRDVAGNDFSAKDFRTWGGTLAAAQELAAAAETLEPGDVLGKTRRTRTVNRALDAAAARLRNTRAVARRSYVHPGVVTAFVEGSLAGYWEQTGAGREGQADHDAEQGAARDLSTDERCLLALLESLPPSGSG